MKDLLIKNLHWFIIAYAVNNLYVMYSEKSEQLQNLQNATPGIQAKINREKRALAQIEDFKKNLSKTKERVLEVVKQIEKTQRQLPADVKDTEVQELLGGIANKLKMQSVQQSPGKEENNGFYFNKEYSFKAKGTFLQSLIFFESLSKAERILNVKKVKIEHDEAENRSRFQIVNMETTVESFRYNSSHVEKSGVEEIENQFK